MCNGRIYSWDEATDEGCIEHIVDGCRGVCIPQWFCETRAQCWDGIEKGDLAVCAAGPGYGENDYWECWQQILNGATYTDPADGTVWSLYQDGDLYMIRTGIQIDWDSAA